jgi:hypothetical protein
MVVNKNFYNDGSNIPNNKKINSNLLSSGAKIKKINRRSVEKENQNQLFNTFSTNNSSIDRNNISENVFQSNNINHNMLKQRNDSIF